jgi:hypothetical protein
MTNIRRRKCRMVDSGDGKKVASNWFSIQRSEFMFWLLAVSVGHLWLKRKWQTAFREVKITMILKSQLVCLLNSILSVILADVCWSKQYNWKRLISRPDQRREPRHRAGDTDHLFLVDRLSRIRFSNSKGPGDQEAPVRWCWEEQM